MRKDAHEKVTGQARYAADFTQTGTLYARVLLSPVAHGVLRSVDVSEAERAPGVLAVVTGSNSFKLTGPLIQDRPPLAYGRIRYKGEPVALAVAGSEAQAATALERVSLDVLPLPVVNTVGQALSRGAPVLHPDAASYEKPTTDTQPVPGTNIAAQYRVYKGDPASAWPRCAHVVERAFQLPHSAHLAMEVRVAQAELRADGTLRILSSTQSPYAVRKMVADALGLEAGKVVVETAFVGGAFGGKSAISIEFLAALAAMRVPGRRVKLVITREQDFLLTPGRLALEARVRLGADAQGRLLAAELHFDIDAGAYADIIPNIAKAIAVDGAGPYRIDNLSVDTRAIYTNHTYSTAFRGFGHESCTFALERAMDALADAAAMDPLAFRRINAIRAGDLTPTQVEVTRSNTGDLDACLERLGEIMDLKSGYIGRDGDKIRARGIACLWKSPCLSGNATAGCVITFNADGSVNLNLGVVEMGNGAVNRMCQMAAERLRMDYARVHAPFSVDTRRAPVYWKTVASLSNFLLGKAVLRACDDALAQMKQLAAVALRCDADELDHGGEKIFVRANPRFGIGYQDLCGAIQYPDGNAWGRPVIGRGTAVMQHVGPLAPDSGKGKIGQGWTVGAEGVEIEYNPRECTYRLLNAYAVIDVGALIDEPAARGTVMGGMAMGLSLARGEQVVYDGEGIMENTSMRTYKALTVGDAPAYHVAFILTPQEDAPMGVRCYSEHGVIAMPAALANALTRACGAEMNALPLSFESVWHAAEAGT